MDWISCGLDGVKFAEARMNPGTLPVYRLGDIIDIDWCQREGIIVDYDKDMQSVVDVGRDVNINIVQED
jgi:hypothetical protein